jgi:RNA polymerase sigma-70 factor (ECF subfamily)
MEVKIDNNKEQWLNEHGDYLYRYAMKKVRDPEVALDLIQETLLAAWKGNFRGDSSVRTWLVGILKHKTIDFIRKQIRHRKLIENLTNDPLSNYFNEQGTWLESQHNMQNSPERMAQNGQLQQHLMDCISSLNEQQRTVFILREVNGESTENVCRICGITPSNLHVIMHRARLALCKCLTDLGYSSNSKAIRNKKPLLPGYEVEGIGGLIAS